MSVNTKIIGIAKICYQANKAFCETIGDDSQVDWEAAPDWAQNSLVNGVTFHLSAPRQVHESHENWLLEKARTGWVYGEVKDPEKKTHPNIVPFEDLPWEQQFKDALFLSIVMALSPIVVRASQEEINAAKPN